MRILNLNIFKLISVWNFNFWNFQVRESPVPQSRFFHLPYFVESDVLNSRAKDRLEYSVVSGSSGFSVLVKNGPADPPEPLTRRSGALTSP